MLIHFSRSKLSCRALLLVGLLTIYDGLSFYLSTPPSAVCNERHAKSVRSTEDFRGGGRAPSSTIHKPEPNFASTKTETSLMYGYKSSKFSRDTLYDILGVSPTSTREEIYNAYILLARKTHPDSTDKCSVAIENHGEFSEISAAWTVLSDPNRRKTYDVSLRFSTNVRSLVTDMLDEIIVTDKKPRKRSQRSEAFTVELEGLVSDLIENVGGNDVKLNYLPQSEYTISALVISGMSTPRKAEGSTYYDILGVSRDASRAEIKQAYLELARKSHPDTRADDCKLCFTEISEAWRTLSDSKQRLRYDRSLLANSFTQEVESMVSRILEKVGSKFHKVQTVLDEVAVPFIREVTANTLSAASRVKTVVYERSV